MDKDKNGHIEIEELRDGLSQFSLILSGADNDETVDDIYKDIMTKVDLDGDGKIDYEEFVNAAIDHRSLIREDNIKSIFNLFDFDGNGFITKEELMQNFKQSDDKDFEEIF